MGDVSMNFLVFSLLFVFTQRCRCQTTTPETNATTVVVFRGEAASLQCTQYSADIGIRWSTYSNGVSTDIASLIKVVTDIHNRIVNSPWKERQWTIQNASGDLIIPNVLLSDEGTYQCRPISGTILSTIKLQVHVRPTSFSIEPASLISVNLNTSINATCTADEVRPEPELYWELCGEHIPSTNSSFLVDSTYNVYGYSSSVFHTVVGEDHGCLLTCKLMMQTATEEKSLLVQVNGFGSDADFPFGAVIGGVVAAIVVIGVIVAVCCCCKKKRRQASNGSVKISRNADEEGVQYAAVNKPRPANRSTPPVEPEYIYTKPQPPPVPRYNDGLMYKNNNETEPEVNYAQLDKKLLNANRYKQGPPKPPRTTETEYADIANIKKPSLESDYESENPYYIESKK